MKNWKKMIVTAAALAALALFAGCTTASAVSLEEAKELVQETMGAKDALVVEQETDREDGVYELEIIIDGVGYEFEVDSRTGEVREMEREGRVPAQTKPAETKHAESNRITLEEAKAIAYAHAGVKEADAYDKSYERDDGRYEIDFEYDGWEYDYEIALDGTIVKSEKEPERVSTAAPAETKPVETKPAESNRITLEEAKAIAYAHAGVKEADAYDKSYERDDGRYEIDFEYDGWEYDYDIAPDGTIVKSEKEPERVSTAAPAETKPVETKPAEPNRITLEEAKAIAYAHAGVKEADAYDKSYERDDGRYEIDFDYDGYEYEYDISYSGEILKSRKDRDDDDHGDSHKDQQPAETKPVETKPTRISAEEALAIALKHAGVTDIRDRDVEWDDGRWEVSFDSGRTEYEYKISADGTILRWEKETDD